MSLEPYLIQNDASKYIDKHHVAVGCRGRLARIDYILWVPCDKLERNARVHVHTFEPNEWRPLG